MTNTQLYWKQMKKFSSKITVLVRVTTFESYGSSSDNSIPAAVKSYHLKVVLPQNNGLTVSSS